MIRRRTWFTVGATIAFGVAFVLWTVLLRWTSAVDRLWPFAAPGRDSDVGQFANVVAIILMPTVVYIATIVLAIWSARRQLTTLAAATLMAVALSMGGGMITKDVVDRPRPASPWLEHFSTDPWSYPSGHVAAISTAAIMLLVTLRLARSRRGVVNTARVLAPLAVVVVAVDRLALGVHHVSDVVGGALIGGFTSALACLICGVHLPRGSKALTGRRGRAAVIYNPTKVVDEAIFRNLIQRRLDELGWDPPRWLLTEPDDPGRGMAQQAVEAGVDLILVAGGDGTVRVISGQLAGTDAVMAIIPSGTGNLLARNLDIPLDMDRALDVAFHGRNGAIDVLRVQSPGVEEDYAAVMCGVGADAAVLGDTDENLKRQIGIGAYVVAALGHIRTRSFPARITVDDGDPIERNSSLVMVCNVSDLYSGLRIAPTATATDGLLDVLVASPQSQGELAALVTATLAQTKPPESLETLPGRRVRIELGQPERYQLDGDVQGEATELSFEVLPGAVNIRVPG